MDHYRAGSGCPDVLLRVPRAARSSLTCAKRPGNPIPAPWRSSVRAPVIPSQRQGGGTRQSEVKEEAEGRGTRTAAGAPTLLRVQKKHLEHCHQDSPHTTTNANIR
jgi:hypothetical protein